MPTGPLAAVAARAPATTQVSPAATWQANAPAKTGPAEGISRPKTSPAKGATRLASRVDDAVLL